MLRALSRCGCGHPGASAALPPDIEVELPALGGDLVTIEEELQAAEGQEWSGALANTRQTTHRGGKVWHARARLGRGRGARGS
jgi:hypothetical protein